MNTFIKRLGADIPLLSQDTLAFLLRLKVGPLDIELAEHPAMCRMREACAPRMELRDGIATVPVQGTLAHNPDPFEMAFLGVENCHNVTSLIQGAAENPEVKGVLLRMDTPGGMMLGGPEIADAVKACRKAKPIVAHTSGLCASLGYMIASQANEVLATPSAIVGSIGVIASVADYTKMLDAAGIKIEYITNKEAKFKAAGAIGTSLTDDQRSYFQSQVDGAFSVFKYAVQSARPQVKPEAMQGQTFRGAESRALGLIDRTGDERFALSVLKSLIPNRNS